MIASFFRLFTFIFSFTVFLEHSNFGSCSFLLGQEKYNICAFLVTLKTTKVVRSVLTFSILFIFKFSP